MQDLITLSAAQLATVRRTVAVDLDNAEFDLFMGRCVSAGLDPFKKQICAIVYNKDAEDRSKRKVAFITEIAGYRALAEKARNYRPAESDDDEVIETNDSEKHIGTNPHGIVSATYYAHKQDSLGLWHRVRGRAYWDEFVPLKEIWRAPSGGGKKEPTGEFYPLSKTSNWYKMGRHMLMKCAEAHALRKGWPDQIPGDIYTREEMDQADAREAFDLELTASQVVENKDTEERKAMLGGPSITLLWAPGMPMEGVPMGQVADRCFQFIDEQTDVDNLRAWQETNAVGLRQFWAEHKSDALNIKRAVEKKIEALT